MSSIRVRYFGDMYQGTQRKDPKTGQEIVEFVRADDSLNYWLKANPDVKLKKLDFVCNCDPGGNTYHAYNVTYVGVPARTQSYESKRKKLSQKKLKNTKKRKKQVVAMKPKKSKRKVKLF